MRDDNGQTITPTQVPAGMCQPPVDAMALIDRLGADELRDVLRTMTIWAPEAFEKGLQRLGEYREWRQAWQEQHSGGAR